MGTFYNVDLTRLSREALNMARSFDVSKDKSLQEDEYNNFMKEWNKEHNGKSPLLMQLHLTSLDDESLKIAQKFDNLDEYKGVLTEVELKNFIEYCEEHKIRKVFKKGTTLGDVLNGTCEFNEKQSSSNPPSKCKLANEIAMYYKLMRNFKTFKDLNYLGSDKYFHAVGNYQSMQLADYETVKGAFDKEASKKKDRPDYDTAEDMYANWIGRMFGEMYKGKDAYTLFEALAPQKMDVNKCRY